MVKIIGLIARLFGLNLGFTASWLFDHEQIT